MITRIRIKNSIIIIFIIAGFSCKKETPVLLPSVSTTAATAVLYTTATTGGTVTEDGGGQVFSGVCWSVVVNPTIDSSKTLDGSGPGSFESTLKGLKTGTVYYVRAYATNSAGTEYGNQISFRTHVSGTKFNPSLVYGTLTDIDGNNYKTIPIGSQVWMAENLKTVKFSDGSGIPLVTLNGDWSNLVTPGYCWFDNNDSMYKDIYGAYYNWFAASSGKLCPTGWHVPDDSEWQILVDYLGGDNSAGSKIKEAGTNNWILPNRDATNLSGFTALPGGSRGSLDGNFNGQGIYGGWWSTTEIDVSPLSAAWCRWIHADTTVVAHNQIYKKDGFTIRCLKD